ncbi:MAG: hypothetical protein K8S13_25275 [Desulfobacula sp.]|uniref:hypothetical protein n=1 Tax=Desulfobacula sp. TaxID=2593537 RepID=UPI0025BB7979|nr:hypothetical protein [Desulfobacula sp.]MCD4723142.1 hypothetical protein [Desulfobacula sp.]
MENAFPGYITLNPGETGEIRISPQRVNSELKRTFLNLKNGYYFARNFKLILLTEDMNPYCHLGIGKSLDHYQTSELKQVVISGEINLY